MGFTSGLAASNTEKSLRFLTMFDEVSGILGDIGDHMTNSSHLFEVDDNLESLDDTNNVFIKIVISLQMNRGDPGLITLIEMSHRATEGDSMDDIVGGVGEEDLLVVLGLCKDVVSGIKYVLRNENQEKNTTSDPMDVSQSFIQHLETKLGY